MKGWVIEVVQQCYAAFRSDSGGITTSYKFPSQFGKSKPLCMSGELWYISVLTKQILACNIKPTSFASIMASFDKHQV